MSLFSEFVSFVKETCRCCVRYMDDEPQPPREIQREDSPASVVIIDQDRREEHHFNHSISIVVHGDVRVLTHHNYYQTPPPSPRGYGEGLEAVTGPQIIGESLECKSEI